MAAIFDLRHTQTAVSIPTSLYVLSNPKNMGIAVGISLQLCLEALIFHVRMWIHAFPVWPPPSRISEWYRRVLPLTKTSSSSPNTKPNTQRYFIQPYHAYQGCLLRATIMLILDEFHQSKLLIWRHACLLRSRDVKVMKSMLSCREFICAQIRTKFLSSDKKFTQQRVLWGYFPPIATKGLKSRVEQMPFWTTLKNNERICYFNKIRQMVPNSRCCYTWKARDTVTVF